MKLPLSPLPTKLPTERQTRRLAFAPLLLLLLSATGWAEGTQTELPRLERERPLHLVENAELIEKSGGLLQKPGNTFLAHMRGAQRGEQRFLARREAAAAMENAAEESETPKPAEGTTPLDRVKAELDGMRARVTMLEQLSAELDESESALGLYRDQLLAAQTASRLLDEAKRQLETLLEEIAMRVADGVLQPEEIPLHLTPEQVEKRFAQLAEKQNQLETQFSEIEAQRNQLAILKKKARQRITRSTSQIGALENDYGLEQQRSSIRGPILALNPDQFDAKLTTFREQFQQMKEDFVRAKIEYFRSNKTLQATRQKLEGLNAPDSKQIDLTNTLFRTTDATPAIEAIGAVMEYQQQQQQILEALQPAITQFLETTANFERKIRLLNEHIFEWKVIAAIVESRIKEGKLPEERLPEGQREAALDALKESLVKAASEAATQTNQAKNERVQFAEQSSRLRPQHQRMQKKLTLLRQIQGSSQLVSSSIERLAKLPREAAQRELEQQSEELAAGLEQLKVSRTAYHESQARFDEVRLNIEALVNPIQREVRARLADEKVYIEHKLWGFFGGPPQSAQVTPPTQDTAALSADEIATLSKSIESPAAQEPPLLVDLESYQKLLSTQFELIDQRGVSESKLGSLLSELEGAFKSYISDLVGAHTRVTLLREAAEQLNGRKGDEDDVPLPAAMDGEKSEDLESKLESEVVAAFNEALTQLLDDQHFLGRLERADKTLRKSEEGISRVATLAIEKFDLLQTYQKHREELVSFGESETGQDDESGDKPNSILLRQAERRMAANDSFLETLLGLLPSSNPEGLIQQLTEEYQSLIILEGQAQTMKAMREIIGELRQLSQQELEQVTELVGLLEKRISALEGRQREAWANVEIAIKPTHAARIMHNFEVEYGYRFPIPSPVSEAGLKTFIEEAREQLFDRRTEIATARKLHQLFQQRQLEQIEEEIATYGREDSALFVEEAEIARQIHFVRGYTAEEIQTLPPESLPGEEIAMLQMREGQIGQLRADRMKIHLQGWRDLFTRLVTIIVLAIIANSVAGRLMSFLQRRAVQRGSDSAQSLMLYAVFGSFIRFLIWTLTIVAAIGATGINVGAIFAALGIGGLAIAMASRETIANMIGGITLLIDTPFKAGEVICRDGIYSRVQQVGLRFTQLRENPSDAAVAVPNSLLIGTDIVNITRALETGFRQEATIPISMRNPADKVALAIELITNIIEEKENAELMWIKIDRFDDFALFLYYRYRVFGLKRPAGMHKVQAAINLEIVRRFEAHKIEFAREEIISHFDHEVPH